MMATKSVFQFTDPLLIEMDFSVNREYVPPEGDLQEIPVEISVFRPGPEAYGAGTAEVSLTVNIGGREGTEFPYALSATMAAKFRWEPTLPAETVKAMLSQNAPSLLVGYLRPYIAQITAASPVGVFHLPFMNFVPQDRQDPSKNRT